MLITGTTAFSGAQESELTGNASGSRKRFLDGNLPTHNTLQHKLQQPQLQQTGLAYVLREEASPTAAVACAGTGPSLQSSSDQKLLLNDSAMASTSGRPTTESPALEMSPLMEELLSQIYKQSLEVDAFIRLQNERIQSGLEDARKRHRRAMLSAVEQGVLRCLQQKELELECASRRNAALEEKIRELASENQVWSNAARNNEAMVSSLRATLEHVLLQNVAAALGAAASAAGAASLPSPSQDREEGYGENDCAAPVFPAEDAQSCCYEGVSSAAVEAEQAPCKSCLKREASVLLLPCQHLCLCEQCEPSVDACPVCQQVKKATLQVSMC